MELTDLKGRYRTSTWQVTDQMTVPAVVDQAGWLCTHGQRVLASAYLLALVEDTCWSVMSPFVDRDHVLLGTHFSVTHRAPCAVGDYLDIEVRCTGVEGQTARWTGSATNLRTGKHVADVAHDVCVAGRRQFARKLAAID